MSTKPGRRKTSVTLSDAGKRMLEALSERMGVSQTAILELAIRERAKQEGLSEVSLVTAPPTTQDA